MGLQTTINYTMNGHTYQALIRSNQEEDETIDFFTLRHNAEVIDYQSFLTGRGATITSVTNP